MAKKKDNDNDDDNIDDFIDKLIEQKKKEASKNAKIFKGAIHNYTTGLIPLDYQINPKHPGILGGSIIQLCGQAHSGKTTMALNIASYHMDKGYNVMYLDPEGGLTDEMLMPFGHTKYNDPQFKYVRLPSEIENGGNYHIYFSTILKALGRLQGEETPYIFIVDSISYLRPVKLEFETVRVGDNIPIFNEFLRSLVPLVANTNALVILINGVYADNANKYNDYIIPGGMTLERACSLITVHYQRTNDTSPTCPAHEKTFVQVNKNFAKPYRQKLGIKVKKNKWNHTVTKQSAMDYFFTTDPAFGRYGLDNTHCMLMFLKDNGVLLPKGSPGNYSIGDQNMSWKEWEHGVNNNSEINQLVISTTLNTLNSLHNGEIS